MEVHILSHTRAYGVCFILMKPLTIVKLFSLGLLLIILFLLSFTVDVEELSDQEAILERIAENPLGGALAFLGLAIVVKLLFIPASPLSFIAGYLFGGLAGTILGILSVTISSIIVFFVGRFLGRDAVRYLIEDRWQALRKYDDALRKRGFITTFILRIVPTFPLSVVNLGLAFTGVRVRDFILATIAGTLPGAFLLANAGARVSDLSDPMLYVYAGLFLLLVAGAGFWGWRRTL